MLGDLIPLLSSGDFFKIYVVFFFKIIFQGHYLSFKQFGSRLGPTEILSVLIRVRTVFKGYPQTTEVSASKERVKDKLSTIGPRGYKTFFMLNSTEHEISTAHKN